MVAVRGDIPRDAIARLIGVCHRKHPGRWTRACDECELQN
jgi:hypothetical protein